MKSIQNDENKPESSPRTFWEFLDKWLHKVAHDGERLAPVVKFALIGGACIYVALVAWRIWLISHVLTTFGVDIAGVLPVDPNTAALIHKGLTVLVLFAPDAIFAYVLFNRHVQYWRAWAVVALVCAVGASWWATHEPGLGTHCYVVTPDRGLIESYADKHGQCGIDRPSGLQLNLVTKDILLAIRAMKRGIKPRKLAVSAINAAEMFDAGDGRSLYWFHQDSATGLDFYDGPGFDQATLTPLEPVTHQNAEKIRQYIKQRQETERAANEKAAAEEKATSERLQAQAAQEAQRQAQAEAQRQAQAAQEAQRQAQAEAQRQAQAETQRQAAAASENSALVQEPPSQTALTQTGDAARKYAPVESPAAPEQIVPLGAKKLTADLSVEVTGITNQRTNQRNGFVVTFVFRNTSNRDVMIALNGDDADRAADFRLTDGRGGICQAMSYSHLDTSLRIVTPQYRDFSQVGATGVAQHFLGFDRYFCTSTINDTSNLSLDGSFLVVDGGQIIRASVYFPGIRAAQ